MLRFSPKLRLAPLWPALAAVLITAGSMSYLMPRLLQKRSAEQLLDTLVILSPLVAEHLDSDPEDLQQWLRETAFGSNLRITVIDRTGVVVADSARTLSQVLAMGNHAERPEVATALSRGSGSSVRRSVAIDHDYVYAARRVERPGGHTYVVRLAEPMSQLHEVRGNLVRIAALAAGVALLVIGVISLWLDRRLFGPLAHIIAGAGELSRGRFSQRLEVPEESELAALARALNTLADQVEEQLAVVAADRDHLREILSSMSEGVLVVDRDGRAIFTNAGFQRLFGVVGSVEGRLPLEVTRHPELDRQVEESLRRNEPQRGEIQLLSPDRRTLAVNTAPLRGPTGGAVVVARDTTEMSRLAEMRRDFVANVSHELKTPLAAIRGFAETLRDGALDEGDTARRFTGRILDQCGRLQALLDDLLTLSRLESVDLRAEPRPVDLAQIAQRAVDLVTPLARERQVELEQRASPSRAPMPPLEGDADSLERLLVNLLENAIKYNHPGGRVSLSIDTAGEEVLLTVRDTGLGIPQDALPRIFERFYRVDKGRARDEGGTGLGLAIVKHVVQGHGGRVEVESRPGHGSTFRVRLPR